jgi:hypothetical protein
VLQTLQQQSGMHLAAAAEAFQLQQQQLMMMMVCCIQLGQQLVGLGTVGSLQ